MPRPSLVMLLFAVTAAAPSLAGQSRDATADSLVSLWIDSVGGMTTYERFRSASFTVTTVLYDTVSGRIRKSRPRYVWIKKGPHGEETRVERWEDYGFIAQGFDGRSSWATIDGSLVPDTAKDARQALYVARDLFYWMGLPFKLRDPGVFLHYNGLVERPGRDLSTAGTPGARIETLHHAVGVSFGEGIGEHQDVFTYYFPPGRGFPTEVTYVESGRTNLNRLLWGEPGRFGELGYPVVLRRDWVTLSGKRTKALVIGDVVINPEVPQGMFERR